MFRTSGGFTLIEFLVSIVILMVGLLGLLQTVNVALFHNVNSQIRNEAVVLADQQMSTEVGKGFDQVSTTTRKFAPFSRQVLNTFKSYSVVRTGSTLSNSKQITVTVSWRTKGTRYEHTTTSVVSKTF